MEMFTGKPSLTGIDKTFCGKDVVTVLPVDGGTIFAYLSEKPFNLDSVLNKS